MNDSLRKQQNPRIAGRTREEYIALMASLNFPLPDKIQEVLQPNQTAIDDDKTKFPDLTQLNQVRQLSPAEVSVQLAAAHPPFVLDVREPQEFTGGLGHIPGSTLVPLRELAERAPAPRQGGENSRCRSGVRRPPPRDLEGPGSRGLHLQGGWSTERSRLPSSARQAPRRVRP